MDEPISETKDEAKLCKSSPRLIALASLSGGVVFGLLLLLNTFYVHYFYAGEYYGPFLYAERWGITPAERDAGLLPVYPATDAGWDGQFYYRQSLDPFLLGDGPQFSDNASYRYQRNGVPVLAWAIGKLLGYGLTPAWLYQAVQFGLIAIGFGFIAHFLMQHRLSILYAIAWLMTTALWSLAHGLPDTAADGLFVVACMMLLSKRLFAYTAIASLLLLAREGYATFAATIFLLSLFRFVDWGNASRIKAGILTALPGAVLIAWTAYVAKQLHLPMMAGAKVLSFGFLVDYPFHAYYRAITSQFSVHETRELILKTLAICTIAIVLLQAVLYARRSPLQIAALPYLILMTMTGFTVWENETGYLKTTGAVILIGILQMPYGKSWLLKWVLCMYLVMGCYTCFHFNYKYQAYLHKEALIAKKALPAATPPTYTQTNPSFDSFACEIDAQQTFPEHPGAEDYGWLQSVHRSPYIYRVTVHNRSDMPWYAQQPGTQGRISLLYQLIDKSNGKVLVNQQRMIESDIPAGSDYYESVCIPVPVQHGSYEVHFAMTQNDLIIAPEKGNKPLRLSVDR